MLSQYNLNASSLSCTLLFTNIVHEDEQGNLTPNRHSPINNGTVLERKLTYATQEQTEPFIAAGLNNFILQMDMTKFMLVYCKLNPVRKSISGLRA